MVLDGRTRSAAANRLSAIRRRRRRAASLAAAWMVAAGIAATTPVRATSDNPAADDIVLRWRDGPVRYLLTTEEDAAVRELTTIPDLARFITRFWKRRDPTPKTLVNEFRMTFWKRVRTANQRLRDSSEPGWKSDRGKVYILLGEPIEVETGDVRVAPSGYRAGGRLEAGSGGAGHELERWHYTRERSKSASPEFVVAFVRDETGAWRLSTDPSLSALGYSELSTDPSQDTTFGHPEGRAAAAREATTAQVGAVMAQKAKNDYALAVFERGGQPPKGGIDLELLKMSLILNDIHGLQVQLGDGLREQSAQLAVAVQPPGVESALFANEDLALETTLPSATEMAVTEVDAQGFLAAFTPEARFEFFRAADGSTFVNIGASVPGSGDAARAPAGPPPEPSDLHLYARVTSTTNPVLVRFTTNDGGAGGADDGGPAARGGASTVWAGVPLPPGRYEVTMALEDAGSGRVGRGIVSLDVPDLSGPGLRISSPILATGLTSKEGKLAVVSRSTGVFRRSGELALYFEVYGARPGASFTVTYRFLHRAPEDPERWVPIGKPLELADRTEGAQGWSTPLDRWPTGRYRVEVTVRDQGSDDGEGGATTASLEFQVTD